MSSLLAQVTIPDAVVFGVAAAVILLGALGVVLSRHPVHSALMLVMTLFGVAVTFVAQGADFLAVVQVIVYAGAIVVLFLFVIMLIGVDRREDIWADSLKAQKPIAAILGLLLLAEVALFAHRDWATGTPSTTGPLSIGKRSNVELLADQLFTKYLLAFEVTSALLVIAVIGAVVLARRPPSRTPRRDRRRGNGRGCLMSVPDWWYLLLGAGLFTIGAIGLLVRRNVLVMFMCVELMLNAANLTLVTFSRSLNDIGGQLAVFFVLVVAAAEVVVGLGITVAIFRRSHTSIADDLHGLKG